MISVMPTGQRDGMLTLDSNLHQLVTTRKISQHAALEKAANKKLFGGGAI